MANLHSLVFLFVLSLFGIPLLAGAQLQNQLTKDAEARLAKIEAALEKVLEKNEQLEKRIAVLEEENEALKEAVLGSTQDKSVSEYTEERRLSKEHHGHRRRSRAAGIVQSRHRFQPYKRQSAETIAFTAVLSPPSITVGPSQAIVYDFTITNVGGAYNNKTGIFTAPESGVYTFNFTEMVEPGQNEYLELVKDGQHVLWNYGHANGANHYTSSSRTAIVVVNRGNQVWVRTKTDASHGTGNIHGNTFTTFSGWIIAYSE